MKTPLEQIECEIEHELRFKAISLVLNKPDVFGIDMTDNDLINKADRIFKYVMNGEITNNN